jgi:hypothetical protein
MGREIDFYYDALDSLNNRNNYYDELHQETRLSTSFTYSRKFDNATRFKTGAFVHFITDYNFYKRTVERSSVSDIIAENQNLSVNGSGSTQTLQYYAQLSKDLNEKLTVNAGAHFMYLPLNNTYSLEPRLSLKYSPKARHTLGLAYGLHSKMLPLATYFYAEQDTINGQITERFPNMDLPFVKAHHLIGSYNYATPSGLRFTTEVYYQNLFNVPISTDPDNIYYMLNGRPAFPEQDVESGGTGENYGVDVAIEKFFSSRVYFLITGSVFRSFFSPKNGNRYPTTYANNYVSALTIGREFGFKKGRILQIGARVIYNGGNRYTPLDVAASLAENRYVMDIDQLNALQIPAYFRIDTRIAWRYNSRRVSGNISLDIQNVLNYRNPNNVSYDATNNELFFRNHTSGFVPVLAFQFDF